jgi:lysophospholipase L1-like esterase
MTSVCWRRGCAGDGVDMRVNCPKKSRDASASAMREVASFASRGLSCRDMKIEISRKTAVVVAILLLAAQYALYRGYIELAHYRGEKPMVRSERVMGAITTTKPAREQLVIGFIGDSITEGGTPSPPTSVGKMLSPIAGSVIIVNCAKGGTNVVDWTPGQRFYQTAVKAFHEQNVSWVSLMLGSNVEDAGAGSFAEHLMPLLKALRQEGFKIIIHYPPYSERATRGAGRMRAIQAVLDDAVGKKLCFRGDVAAYEHFHLHPEQLQDGLHPNQAGIAALAELWAAAIADVVERN